jgi:hypothetical protein
MAKIAGMEMEGRYLIECVCVCCLSVAVVLYVMMGKGWEWEWERENGLGDGRWEIESLLISLSIFWLLMCIPCFPSPLSCCLFICLCVLLSKSEGGIRLGWRLWVLSLALGFGFGGWSCE